MSTVPTNPPANPVPGAVYVDLATNTAYVWTGTSWAPSGGSTGYNSQITTGAAILPGYFSQPTPESFAPSVGPQPSNPSNGQLWVDTSAAPSPLYVWDGTAWTRLTDGTFTDTSVSPVPPASPDLGDTYYETSTGRFYIWDGSAWKTIGEGDDTNTIYTAAQPSVRPNGTQLQPGDLWLNSTTIVLSYWDGTNWQPLVGGSGSSATPTTEGTVLGISNNTTLNVALGSNAGVSLNGTLGGNVLLGDSAGSSIVNAAKVVHIGSNAGLNSTGGGNIFIGAESGKDAGFWGGNIILGANSGATIGGSGNFVVSHPTGSGTGDNVRFRINETNAFGFPTTADPVNNNVVNYGNSGEVLTSQGSSGPPVWATPAGSSTSYNVQAVNSVNVIDFQAASHQFFDLFSGDSDVSIGNIPNNSNTSSFLEQFNGYTIKVRFNQVTTNVSFSATNDMAQPVKINNQTSIFVLPTALYQVLTITFYQGLLSSGPLVAELSSPI